MAPEAEENSGAEARRVAKRGLAAASPRTIGADEWRVMRTPAPHTSIQRGPSRVTVRRREAKDLKRPPHAARASGNQVVWQEAHRADAHRPGSCGRRVALSSSPDACGERCVADVGRASGSRWPRSSRRCILASAPLTMPKPRALSRLWSGDILAEPGRTRCGAAAPAADTVSCGRREYAAGTAGGEDGESGESGL